MHSVINPNFDGTLTSNKMAIRVEMPETVYIDDSVPNKIHLKNQVDEVDNPQLDRSVSDDGDKTDKLFESMRHEINRLNSYSGKWPLGYVKPADLAATGLFYLQSDDKVQCAFCRVIIDDWTVGQKPIREHMRNSPKCPFLVSADVGNVPIVHQKPRSTLSSLPINSGTPYTPKHPRMADLKNRLMTYRDWPRIMLSPRQLADCGLYYTGVADVVTCFFCGGSLGNWELDDDPWVEHEKFFSNCTYLRLLKSNGKIPAKPTRPPVNSKPVESSAATNPNNSLHREVIRQACEIFPKSLVEKAVLKRMSDGSQRFTSLNELCEDILELKEQERRPWAQPMKVEPEKNPDTVKTEAVVVHNLKETAIRPVKDILLCKICMDREMGVVFQPCGHLVSCPKCAELIFNCPLCRTPVTNKVRTYLS